MFIRCSAIVLATSLLAGCSNSNDSFFASLNPTTTAIAAPVADQDLSRKTLASKMLTAIALERVTGRKPDPARLAPLN